MAVTDYKFAGTATPNTGGVASAWVNADYAKADDTSYASNNVDKSYGAHLLNLTNFGFSSSDIPDGATIDGIGFVVSRYASSSNDMYDSVLRLINVGTPTNMASATKWPTSIGEATYGGATEKCCASVSQANILSSDFGVTIQPITSYGSYAYVDYIKIRVYYTAGGGATVFLPNIMKHNFIPPLIGGY